MTDDRESRGYEENPRDNFATFDNRDITSKKPKRTKGLLRQLLIRKGLIVLFLGLLGCAYLLGSIWPQKYPYFTIPFMRSVIKSYLSVPAARLADSPRTRQSAPVVENETKVKEPTHHVYSGADIEEAKREVLLKRRIEANKQLVLEKIEHGKSSVDIEEDEVVSPRYSYEIELYSGGRIYTDNAVVAEETVSFVDPGGLWVSINRSDVKKITRTRGPAGNR